MPAAITIACVLVQLTGPGPASDTTSRGEAVTSCECSLVRKNAYRGVVKAVKGHFYYDRTMGVAAYEYDAPFHYRFVVRDTVLYGIDMKKNRGYALRREVGLTKSDGLYVSIHPLSAYLRCAFADAASCTLRASIGPILYLERQNGNGSDMFTVERATSRICLIESFDEKGLMYEQTRPQYAGAGSGRHFPSTVIVRKLTNGMLTADTLCLSRMAINETLPPDRFAPPAACLIHETHSGAEGFVPLDGSK
jgi:hypothetical protein